MIKRITKNIFYLFIICCTALLLALPANAAGGSLQYFGINFSINGGDFVYNNLWWLPEDSSAKEYYLTIPHDAEEITANFGATGDVYLDGNKIQNGQELTFEYGNKHTVSCGGISYTLIPIKGSDIPQIFITTDAPVDLAHKGNEVSGHIYITDKDGSYVYNGVLDEIKGRGNYTWTLPKKPFNIKLDEKTDIFGMGKSKKFSLLANYIDNSLVKNKLVCDLADTIGINFSSKSQIVDLFINGNYFGNYTLIERVEVAENRVEINNLEEQNEELNENIPPEDAPLGGVRGNDAHKNPGTIKYSVLENNPDDITGGYLLEYELPERYSEESSGFVSDYGQTIIVKSPEFASKEQVEYISKYYQEFEDAVLSDDGKNNLGKHYSEYIDVDSIAKMYVLQEFVKNLDGGITSFFMYKDIGGKLVAAPVWDFDSALGREYMRYDHNLANPEGLWVTDLNIYGLEDQGKHTIIALLCKHSDFRKAAAEQWETYFEPNIDTILNTIDSLTSEIHDSAVADKTRWNIENTPTTKNDIVNWAGRPAADTADWYAESVDSLKNYISVRREFVDALFDTDNSYVQYCSNGGNGEMIDFGYYADGDTISVQECAFINSDETKSFHGWNTKPNGFGVQYMPGDEIKAENSIVLYAQWEEQSFIAKISSFFSGLFN